ncbi:MAG: fumarylacetoacetate hydrolase family protein [Chloroflexota bacterium]|nr:fumarylacetoacetate hydrolase family protein [Chloroflexota bacterium]
MRFAKSGQVRYGLLDHTTVLGLQCSPFECPDVPVRPPLLDGVTYQVDDVGLLCPCTPSKVVCLGLNYRSHARELGMPVPDAPVIFLKPSTAVIGPEEPIVLPHISRRVDYEGELGVVIGKRAKNVAAEEADRYILGYTCFNDVTERMVQREDGQWTRAKSYDTFAPLGPWIETDFDPGDVGIETYLNGVLKQSGRTSDLVFGVDYLLSFISQVMTLLPGDVIATGTPSGIGPMNPGDTVEVTVESIGTLRNAVVANQT